MIKEIPGLTANESKVYIALLQMKESGATKLASKCGLFRTLVYDILIKLIEKGLVSSIIVSQKRLYRAARPARLMELLKEKENDTLKVLTELNALFAEPSEEFSVQEFEGIAGVKAVVEDMIVMAKNKEMKESYWLGPTGESMGVFGGYLKEQAKFIKKKKFLKNIDFRIIWSSKIENKSAIHLLGKKENHRFFPEGFNSEVPIIIYGDKIAIYGGESKRIVVLIKNKRAAESFKLYFKFIWMNAQI
jgi:sugar-specific transcriptional regulator TrmB